MSLPDPNTREEIYLRNIGDGEGTVPDPVTRKERYLYKIATGDGDIPDDPHTREEIYLEAIAEGGGGGGGGVPGGKTVTYMVDNAVYATQSVITGDSVEAPERPLYDNKVFGYWCTTEDGTGTEIDFPYVVTDDITLYAIKFDPWLTYKSASSFYLQNSFSKNWTGTVEYSTNGTTWTEWDATSAANAAPVDGEYVLYIRGRNNTRLTGDRTYPVRHQWGPIGSTDVYVTGQLATAFDYEKAIAGKSVETWESAICGLFYNNPYLKSAPHMDLLPISDYMCYQMFYSCTNLSIVHPLPFKDSASYCFSAMFYGCSSLKNAPSIKCESISTYCYQSMFNSCTSLKKVPQVHTKRGLNYAFQFAFANCSNLEEILLLDDFYPSAYIFEGMYNGCSKIKISTAESEEYHNSFRLRSGASDCYRNMFTNTGGTFTGTPAAGTTYYTPNTIVRGV